MLKVGFSDHLTCVHVYRRDCTVTSKLGIADATVTPMPYQQPHPKVRLASTTDDSFSRVGRLGFPIFLSMRGMDVHGLESRLKDYTKSWAEA